MKDLCSDEARKKASVKENIHLEIMAGFSSEGGQEGFALSDKALEIAIVVEDRILISPWASTCPYITRAQRVP